MRLHQVPSLLDRWFEDFDEIAGPASPSRAFRPALDLLEYPDRYEVVVDMPGVDPKTIEVEFTERALQIRGERNGEAASEEVRVFRQERAAGRFGRSVAFRDDVDVDKIEASYRDGVLRVRVPKAERHRPRQIPIGIQ